MSRVSGLWPTSRLHIGTIFGIVFGRAGAQYGSQRYTPAAPDRRLTVATGQACDSSRLEFPCVEECKRDHTHGVRR